MKRRSVLFFALACALGAPAWAFDVDELMRALSAQKVARGTFVERKYIAMLDAPVTSSGELSFTAPSRLERRTLKPRPESVVLDGGTLTITRGERQMVMQVQDHPALGALTESVRGTLAGDRQALERHFLLTLTGTLDRWTLVLKPREPRIRGYVLEVRIAGERGEVQTVEVEQSDRDRSVMTITKVAGS